MSTKVSETGIKNKTSKTLPNFTDVTQRQTKIRTHAPHTGGAERISLVKPDKAFPDSCSVATDAIAQPQWSSSVFVLFPAYISEGFSPSDCSKCFLQLEQVTVGASMVTFVLVFQPFPKPSFAEESGPAAAYARIPHATS